jgi:hypothetical protein
MMGFFRKTPVFFRHQTNDNDEISLGRAVQLARELGIESGLPDWPPQASTPLII